MITRPLLRLQRGSFTSNEWSGGDIGAVGNRANGIAGNEVSQANADFNGVITTMAFSNTQGSSLAWRSTMGTYSGQPSGERPPNPIIPDNYHDLLGV